MWPRIDKYILTARARYRVNRDLDALAYGRMHICAYTYICAHVYMRTDINWFTILQLCKHEPPPQQVVYVPSGAPTPLGAQQQQVIPYTGPPAPSGAQLTPYAAPSPGYTAMPVTTTQTAAPHQKSVPETTYTSVQTTRCQSVKQLRRCQVTYRDATPMCHAQADSELNSEFVSKFICNLQVEVVLSGYWATTGPP